MFEELYEPLPDPEAYLQRIGAHRSPCSLSALDELILAHQLAVPFEDLDCYYTKQTNSLAIRDLFDKIVTRRRGGYCFELNSLFEALLESLGYQAWSSDAKVIRGKDLSSPITTLHRVNLVSFEDGLYFCDVGYGGPMPPFALKVEAGSVRSLHGETFSISKAEGRWWILGQILPDGGREGILKFHTEKVENCDFFVLNHFASTSPLSKFTGCRLVNRRLPEGSAGITDDCFTLHEKGSTETVTIETEEQFRKILKKYFDIVL